mmetsp:Transcript_93379/g.250064  ORF Transcript_93379/g.250064 Transcript_93379/m.250064 type:complete len:236 (+) Transcript_93379:245-952(+)
MAYLPTLGPRRRGPLPWSCPQSRGGRAPLKRRRSCHPWRRTARWSQWRRWWSKTVRTASRSLSASWSTSCLRRDSWERDPLILALTGRTRWIPSGRRTKRWQPSARPCSPSSQRRRRGKLSPLEPGSSLRQAQLRKGTRCFVLIARGFRLCPSWRLRSPSSRLCPLRKTSGFWNCSNRAWFLNCPRARSSRINSEVERRLLSTTLVRVHPGATVRRQFLRVRRYLPISVRRIWTS